MSLLLLLAALSAGPEMAGVAPITIGQGGAVLKDGHPYRAIGINYFSAFSRILENPGDASFIQGFDELVKRDIPFIRFMACGFWPKNWDLYRQDKEEYFRRMDAVVRAAETRHLGLIPSLFWWMPCVPDLVDEPRNQWGNPDSKTIAFMRQYVKEVVTRYLDSPAVWAWELGNEYSLDADLPNAAECRPWVKPDLGTRKQRGPDDDMTHDMIVTASREFAKAIRTYDTRRPITPGHSLPRPAASHLRADHSWKQDTRDEFAANLLDVNPDPANLISVHVYPFDKKRFDAETVPYAETMSLCVKAAAKANKAMFVGEFGAPDTEKDGGPAAARTECLEMIAAIESSGVPLSALWVFDLSDQDSFINVTPANARSYLLEEIRNANHRLAGKP